MLGLLLAIAQVAFELLQELLEEPGTGLVSPHMAALLEIALRVAAEVSMDDETRMAALNLVASAVEHKRKVIVKQKPPVHPWGHPTSPTPRVTPPDPLR